MTLQYKAGQTVVVGELDQSFEWDELEEGMHVVINHLEVTPGQEFYHVTPVGEETYPIGTLLIGDDEISGLAPA